MRESDCSESESEIEKIKEKEQHTAIHEFHDSGYPGECLITSYCTVLTVGVE